MEDANDMGRHLAWLLALGAMVVFTAVYLPARRRARAQERLVARVRRGIARQRAGNALLEQRCAALAASAPAAVEEEIRAVLRKGSAGDYVFPRDE